MSVYKVFFQFTKRAVDIVFAGLGLVLTAPLLAVCAIAIKVDSDGPVLFRQTRVGRYGRHFRILKLRSMAHTAGNQVAKLTVAGDSRITRVGRWLRAGKLDELPQLYNVLRGDMSLVGPRPEVPEYVANYTPKQKEIFRFRPGLTSPASVSYIQEEALLLDQANPDTFYRQHLLPIKLGLDLEYCSKASLATDILLLATTIFHLARRTNHSVR